MMLRASGLTGLPGLRHGFFSRQGGVSTGIYAALNCGFGSRDDPAAVAENRARVAGELGAGQLLTVHQVHGTAVAVAETPWDPRAAPKADAVVTRQPGLAVGVLAADCAPVLLADAGARVIGAAHAGWRGARAGVVEAAVAAMEELGARRERILAAIGPCIGPDSYEVGPDLVGQFPEAARCFRPGRGDRSYFDLPGYLEARVAQLGLAGLEVLRHDTLAEPERWFSYRRSCLDGEPDYGRQVSALCLT